MYKKLSKISLFFFIAYYNYILLRFIIFPHLYDTYGANGIYIIVLMLAILIVLFLILPSSLYNYDFSKNFQKSKIRFVYKPLLFLRIVFGLSASTLLLQELFFNAYPFWLILIGLVVVIAIISLGTSCDIVQLSTLFCIVGTSLYILYFFDFLNMDITLLNNSISFEVLTLPYIFILIIDNFNYFLINKEKTELKKTTAIAGITFSIVLFAFEYLVLLLTSGDKVFYGNQLSGFLALAIQPVSRYNGNFSYVYLVIITIAVVFKFAYFNTILINKSYTKVKYILYTLLIIICSMGLSFVFKFDYQLANILVIALILSCGILPIWLLKEAYHV